MTAPAGAGAARDTIAAIATPPGTGAIGVIRVSGPHVKGIATDMLGRVPAPRHAVYAAFRDHTGGTLDRGMALYFPAPASFTGEDILELHGHGGAVVMDLLLARVLDLGARLARPGEFSERAFLNGKIDLAQAEAIADLINSASTQAARAAMVSLQGEFSRNIGKICDAIDQLRVQIEAQLDFSDQEIDPRDRADQSCRLTGLASQVDAILAASRQGVLMSDGIRVVIAGRPNAGKSSLLNRLARRDRAIVSTMAGTTRDTLDVDIVLGAMPVHLTDTAGVREAGDEVEREGMRRAYDAIARADHVLLLVPCDEAYHRADLELVEKLAAGTTLTLVRSKCDLLGSAIPVEAGRCAGEIQISAQDGVGIDGLEQRIQAAVGYNDAQEGGFAARRRHVEALRVAHANLRDAACAQEEGAAPELVAEHLRWARLALSEITGAYTTEDLLGAIFSTFCIGK